MKYCLLLFVLLVSCSPKIEYSRVVVINGKLMGILPLDEDGEVYYNFTVRASGATTEQVFRRSRRWFVQSYRSAKDVWQVADPVSGELIGKASFASFSTKTKKETDATYSQSDTKTTKYYEIGETISITAKPGGCVLEVSGLTIDGDAIERSTIIGNKAELLTLMHDIDDHINNRSKLIQRAINSPDPEMK